MSNQDTGNSPILKGRNKRREKLKAEEFKAYKKLVDGPDPKLDLAEDLQLSRATIYNIYDRGYGHSESIRKIRAKLVIPVQPELSFPIIDNA